MDAGVFRDRVMIQKRTAQRTADGEDVTWTDVQMRWARVMALDARARREYQQLHGEVTHKVVFRAPLEVSLADDRFLWRSKVLVPVAPPEDPDGLGRFVTIAVAVQT